ncbi:MAG: aminopeptidase [Lachnospiraceae bacterium]|nr:aminopeptidase [Lachnospiraceae bacterium]
MERKNVWEKASETRAVQMEAFAREYMTFLSEGKTERECVKLVKRELEAAGYRRLEEAGRLLWGDKVYTTCMNKAVVAFCIGDEPLTEGMNILGAHIDSPRLDIKQNPLYEDGGFALLDTHYYGGIKKYQWVTIPLAIHGLVALKDGRRVEIAVGEAEDDPVFFVSDLLIHLAQEQLEKKAGKVIEGEALDVIVGNRPLVIEETEDKKKEKDPVKAGVLAILKRDYDIEEEDFLSAELEVVPAGRARFAGFDRSMILGYGHDDRVCAYASLRAMLEVEMPKRTTCLILVDKEEIGSVGATGMQSKFFENAVAEVMHLADVCGYSDLRLRRVLARSTMLSSDVSSAFDPAFASSFDKKNVARLGGGMVFNKFTGARGKYDSNDANAEYLAHIRHIMDEAEVVFQTAELGRVDLGGGGTIAYILALYGMNVVDCGVAVLNMHAPWEAVSVADVYEAKRGYRAFLEGACRVLE